MSIQQVSSFYFPGTALQTSSITAVVRLSQRKAKDLLECDTIWEKPLLHLFAAQFVNNFNSNEIVEEKEYDCNIVLACKRMVDGGLFNCSET